MKKKISILLCILLVVMTALCAFGIETAAGSASISYSFSGTHSADQGFAEGTITLTAESGTYRLYWADNSAGLTGYDPIATLTISSGSASFKMPAYTAIPAKATKILAFKGSSAPSSLSASGAAAAYTIPASKALAKTDDDLLYSFAALSDTHIESNNTTPYDGWTAKYPYDELHLTSAFNTAAARGVDFIVTTGDHVNNQRNDKNGGNNNLYAEEWNTYLKILANSNFTGPVYEAIGNHEVWNYETESNKTPKDWKSGSDYFVQVTGLDSTAASVNSGKAYYEITEPVTGDHFLFMALEGGFYTDANNEFSDAQLTWLENKLRAYQNDGKNVFIMQHANFDKWGAGDNVSSPVYNLPLKDSSSATVKLKNILKTYKNAVMISGHTHLRFSEQQNYSDNNGTSATIIHNSSVGGIRELRNGSRYDDKSKDQTEGYIVEVYDDATIFYGTNLYYNSIMPTCSYIVAQNTSAIEQPTEAPEPTEPASLPPLPTNPPLPTEPMTEPPTEPATEPEPEIIWGDVDNDSNVTILDATAIQRHLASLEKLDDTAQKRGRVTGSDVLSILDATAIQRKLASIIKLFPVEEPVSVGAAAPEAISADLSTLRTQAKNALDKYWLLASYDQYLALKKAYKENADYDTLNAAYAAFNQAVTDFYPGDNITIHFNAPANWSSVNAYIYNSDSDKLSAWPGKACSHVSGSIWKVTVPTGRYNYIVFNSGSSQTIDLALGVTKNQTYFTDGQYNGKYKCRLQTS